PTRRDLVGQYANAIAALHRCPRARKGKGARAIGPRPGISGQRERRLVDAWLKLDAELLPTPESEKIAQHRRREWARQLEGAAVVTHVPVRNAEILRECFGLAAAGDGLDARRHNQRSGRDATRRRDSV